MKLYAPLLLMVLAGAACTSTEEKPADDLDVTQDEAKPADPATTAASGKLDPGAQVPASAVMNWQAFFKAPPSEGEKRVIEQRLGTWQDSASAAEHVAKGRAEMAVGRAVAAEVSFRKALRLDSHSLEASLELAALYLRKKDLPKTFEFLQQVKDGIGTSSNVAQAFIFRYRYTLALAYVARGDRDKGHKVLSDLIAVEKGFAPAYQALATSYLGLARDSVAEFVVRRGLDRAKDDAGLLNLMGVISQRRGETEAARGWFDKALAAAPTFAPARVNRAHIAIKSFEYGAAEEDLKQAMVHDPTNVDALVALGIAQRRQGNVSGAKAAFTKAVDIAPENPHARFNLAVLMADDLKKPHEALRLFQEVLQTSEPSADLKELARAYINDLRPIGQPY